MPMSPVTQFGEYAGKVYDALNHKGPLSETKLLTMTLLDERELQAAIGWLARENKICKNGTVYKLGQTNLTPKIGMDAGKLYGVLSQKGETDVQTLARMAHMDVTEAFSAIGWLAREEKIATKVDEKQSRPQLRVWLK
jgi:hypothetical protein